MSGTIFSVCSISAISALPAAPSQSGKIQERTGEESVMAKSKPKMNLVSKIVGKSSTALSSSASDSLGTLRAQSQDLGLIASAVRPAAIDSNDNEASRSQVWQSGAKSELKCGETHCGNKKHSVIDDDWPHNLEISDSVLEHLEKIFSNLRQKVGRHSGNEVLDLNVKSLIW